MSAVFGLFRFDRQPVDAADLHAMHAALAMHGPDAGGVWLEGHVGLGYRLMRFTPEDNFERQPLVLPENGAPESRLCLVSDGRIDNRPELMEELSIPASEARHMPDSAFILRAYEKWGPDCPRHLIGAFAFALYDSRENSLLLARSPRGERTLFYHTSGNVFAFSTAPKGLFALPFVPRNVNRERIADLLAVTPPDPGASFFDGVHRLRQGHALLVRPGGLKTIQYWQLYPRREIRFSRDQEYVEAFTALLNRVVGDSLRSLTPVGIMMSGGFDSTSIAAIAAQRLAAQGARLPAFTEVPPAGLHGPMARGRYADETPYVMAMTRRYGNLDLHLVRTDGACFLDGIDRFFRAAEVPFRNGSNRPYWETIQEQAARQGVRVLLTGCLGNFTISWAGLGVMTALLKSGKWKRLFQEARALARTGASPSTFDALGRAIVPLLPETIWRGVQCLRHRGDQTFRDDTPWRSHSAIRPEFAKEFSVEERARKTAHQSNVRPGTDYRVTLLPRRDAGGDVPRGHEAMFGVQTRDPANDQRIVEFCLGIPEDQYLRDGAPRWLIRRAMAEHLPPEILSNPLRGLQAADWLDRFVTLKQRFLDELDLQEQSDLARQAIDLERLRDLVKNASAQAWNVGKKGLGLRMQLDVGIMTGRFLRWAESGA